MANSDQIEKLQTLVSYKEALEQALNRLSKGDISFFMVNPSVQTQAFYPPLQNTTETFLNLQENDWNRHLQEELTATTATINSITISGI